MKHTYRYSDYMSHCSEYEQDDGLVCAICEKCELQVVRG